MSKLIFPIKVKGNLLSDFLRILVERFSTLGMEDNCKPKAAISDCWSYEEINAENLKIN